MATLKHRKGGKWYKVLGALGVETFNGRAGAVTPQAGDYTADMVGAARVASGSYEGTGTWGPENPNSITFEFQPKVVLFSIESRYYVPIPYLWGDTSLPVQYCDDDTANLYRNNKVTVAGNTMTWYAENLVGGGSNVQLNAEGTTYRWVAIG